MRKAKPSLWVIELHNGEDSRLTPALIENGLRPALDAVERHWREQWREAKKTKNKEGGGGALIFVGKRNQDKFFSNGLDFVNVTQEFFHKTFNPFLERILTFPIPTVAAINGHCFAGAFIFALTCDYRVMTDGSKRNAWMCMNEVHFGATWPLSLSAVVRAKIGDGKLHRKIALEGYRFTPKEALEHGIVDHIVNGNTAAVLAKAEAVAGSASKNAKEGVWGLIKTTLYRDTLEDFRKEINYTNAFLEDAAAKARL